MSLAKNKNQFKEFCWGRFEVQLDESYRIRLNKAIVQNLKSQKVTQLWLYPGLTNKNIILCPPANQKAYRGKTENGISEDQNYDILFRKYIATGQLKSFDTQGRITLTQDCTECLSSKQQTSLVILGMGLWYEVWLFDNWADEIHNYAL